MAKAKTVKIGYLDCSPPLYRCSHCWEPILPERDVVWMRHSTQKVFREYAPYCISCALALAEDGQWISIIPKHRRQDPVIVDLRDPGWRENVAGVVAEVAA